MIKMHHIYPCHTYAKLQAWLPGEAEMWWNLPLPWIRYIMTLSEPFVIWHTRKFDIGTYLLKNELGSPL